VGDRQRGAATRPFIPNAGSPSTNSTTRRRAREPGIGKWPLTLACNVAPDHPAARTGGVQPIAGRHHRLRGNPAKSSGLYPSTSTTVPRPLRTKVLRVRPAWGVDHGSSSFGRQSPHQATQLLGRLIVSMSKTVDPTCCFFYRAFTPRRRASTGWPKLASSHSPIPLFSLALAKWELTESATRIAETALPPAQPFRQHPRQSCMPYFSTIARHVRDPRGGCFDHEARRGGVFRLRAFEQRRGAGRQRGRPALAESTNCSPRDYARRGRGQSLEPSKHRTAQLDSPAASLAAATAQQLSISMPSTTTRCWPISKFRPREPRLGVLVVVTPQRVRAREATLVILAALGRNPYELLVRERISARNTNGALITFRIDSGWQSPTSSTCPHTQESESRCTQEVILGPKWGGYD